MIHEVISSATPETVPLQNAVLCVDCELVTCSRNDECPVCGGRSLLSLAGIIGGTLVDFKQTRLDRQRLLLFDLKIELEMSQLEGRELSAVVEAIGKIVAPKLGRNRASLHMSVNPVESTIPLKLKAA